MKKAKFFLLNFSFVLLAAVAVAGCSDHAGADLPFESRRGDTLVLRRYLDGEGRNIPEHFLVHEQPARVLADSERALATRCGFDERAVALLTTVGDSIRPLRTGWSPSSPASSELAIEFVAGGMPTAGTIFRLNDSLRRFGCRVFLLDQDILGAKSRIALVRGTDQFHAFALAREGAYNFPIDSAEARLRQWDHRFGVRIVGVGFDWVWAVFVERPDDMQAFAREVVEFCPDVLAEEARNAPELAQHMLERNAVHLWWD